MALSPEIVADILQIELNENCVGDWYQNGHGPRAIEQKAMERATSPESFTDWLVRQYFFRLRTGVELYAFKAELTEKLSSADLTVITENIKTTEHNILYIDSIEFAEDFEKLIKIYAKNDYGIPTDQVRLKHISYPPEATKFVQLLSNHSGAVLHNLSLGDLLTINEAIIDNPDLATRLVVVMTGGSTTGEHERLYDLLSKQGVMVVMKPFPSIEEVVRVVLGVV